MSLTIALPPLDARPADPPETRPATVARWLEGLLRGDPVTAAHEMSDALGALNRLELRDTRRRRLADHYATATAALWSPLEAKFVRASQPLTGEALDAARSAVGLAFELGVAYKRLLVRHAGRRLAFGGKGRRIQLVQRCLEATARILTTSYLSYSPVPPKTWLDAHAVYAFARERGWTGAAAAGDEPDTAPEPLYVQMLLLALANPYGFRQGDLATVIEYVRSAWRMAKLTDIPPVHRLAKAVAIAPVGHDFPPFAASKGGAVEGEKMYLLTFDLAFELEAQIQALEAGAPTPQGIEPDAASRLRYLAVLKRLLRQWAIPPARQFNRVPSRSRVLMCAGLPAVWQNLVNAQAGERRIATGLPPMTQCQVVNHTPAGYALRQTDAAPTALRIGDLVAVQAEGRVGMQVALVRWFRNTPKGSGLEFGCELLSEQPAAALGSGEGAANAAKAPVILLPEDAATMGHDGAASQAIVPALAFAAEQAVSIERDSGAELVVLTKLVEEGPGFALFDCTAVG
jgi:hypothetical protein